MKASEYIRAAGYLASEHAPHNQRRIAEGKRATVNPRIKKGSERRRKVEARLYEQLPSLLGMRMRAQYHRVFNLPYNQ